MIARAMRTPTALLAALFVHAVIVWMVGRPAPPPRFELSGLSGVEISLAALPAPLETAVDPEPSATAEPKPPPPPKVEPPKPRPDPVAKPKEPVPKLAAATPVEPASPPEDSAAATASTAARPGTEREAPLARAAVPNAYLARLSAWLERHKRYPAQARIRRQEGIVELRFVMDRKGNVLDSNIEKSSGHFLLDQEGLTLVRRAAPFPPIPDDIDHERLELVLPVGFRLR